MMEKWVTETNYGPVLWIIEDGNSYLFSLDMMTPDAVDEMVEELEEEDLYAEYASTERTVGETSAIPYHEWRSSL